MSKIRNRGNSSRIRQAFHGQENKFVIFLDIEISVHIASNVFFSQIFSASEEK